MKNESQHFPHRIAIVGGGVSGLSAAWFLEDAPDIEVTLYERLNRLGGNAVTVDGKTADGKAYAVDPVAYLFVTQRYPYFTEWLRQLGVKTTFLDFDNYLLNARQGRGTLITSNLRKLLFSPGKSVEYFRNLYQFRKVVKTINRLQQQGKLHDGLLMSEFIAQVPSLNSRFLNEVFYPLMTFAFHTEFDTLEDKPCGAILRSYACVANDPKATYKVEGGVRTYIQAVRSSLKKTKIMMNAEVRVVRKLKNEQPVWIVETSDGDVNEYDEVILALWPHQAAEVLRNGLEQGTEFPELREMENVLKQVELAHCRATVHTDSTVMPDDKRHWATYSYKFPQKHKFVIGTIWSGQDGQADIFTTYDWSLRPEGISNEHTLTRVNEPVHAVNLHVRTPPRQSLFRARELINARQGDDGLWFTGCFMRENGFHEDGLRTTVEVLKKLLPDHQKLYRLQSLMNNAPIPFN